MGRPRKNYTCPKCGKQGYLEKKSFRRERFPYDTPPSYLYVVHYNSITKKRNRHYVDNIAEEQEVRNIEQLKQQVRELEQRNSRIMVGNEHEINFYQKEIERLESKLKKSMFKGKSEFKFKGKVIPVKYQFFPYPVSNPKLVLAVDDVRGK
jgi:hypothetical protein